jgi:predicted transposase YbfD/YdcC
MDNYSDMIVFMNFNTYFGDMTDYRQKAKIQHSFTEVLFIAILATISGADDCSDIEDYAKTKRAWLSTFLELKNGIPSHDTFNRILCAINPVEFQARFVDWVNIYKDKLPVDNKKDIIPIDGKTICNSADESKAQKAIHMVSAMSTKHGFVLGQKKCAEKSNEITAIPELIDVLDITGAIITIDAMGCQKKIEEKIINKGADYILALKGNQGNLFDEVKEFFGKTQQKEFQHYIHQTDTQTTKGHGRIEIRECTTISNLNWLLEPKSWKSIKCIAKIKATVIKGSKETVDERFYISSLPADAKLINYAIQTHWHIENKLHWVLDVIFKEDFYRLRTKNGAENMNIVRKIAFNHMKADVSDKSSMKAKRKKCGWSDNYAAKVLWMMMS